MNPKESPEQIAWSILLPLMGTLVVSRSYLHWLNPDADFFILGYNIHHLFTGALVEIPCALYLAFGVGSMRARQWARIGLGVGTGLVLDEIIYLITTDGSNRSYLTPISVWGAVTLIALACLLIFVFYRMASKDYAR